MNIARFFIGTLLGYFFGILIIFFIFDYFSWGLTIGLLAGLIIYTFIQRALNKRKR